MPSIITDPSLSRTSGIINNGMSPAASIWTFPDAPAQSILNFQAVPTQPLPGGTESATGLISPPALLRHQLKNFSPEVYELAANGALVHFMQALLGDSGVGQLRKRQVVARLQENVTSSSFYDLDAFYGALFTNIRGPAGTLPTNPATGIAVSPYTDLATPDGWDQVEAIDAVFRERIVSLARAITLGATVPGLQALAEAITGYKCHVYEVWRIIDNQGPQPGIVTLIPASGTSTTSSNPVTWYQVQAAYSTWNALPAGITWNLLQGFATTTATPVTPQQLVTSNTPSYGGFGINCRSEVIIVPRRTYPSTPSGQTQWAADQYGIGRVTEVLKPANVLLSVSNQSQLVSVPVPPAAIWSDSDYWEVMYKVNPVNLTDPAYAKSQSAYQKNGAPVTTPITVPAPPKCRKQGTKISHAKTVTTSWSTATSTPAPGVIIGPMVDAANFETEVINGQVIKYTAPKGIQDPVRATTARTASAVGVQSAPYSGPRQKQISHS